MLQEYVINQAKQQIMMQAEARGEEVNPEELQQMSLESSRRT
jgi:hypothetical protein